MSLLVVEYLHAHIAGSTCRIRWPNTVSFCSESHTSCIAAKGVPEESVRTFMVDEVKPRHMLPLVYR